VRCAIRMTPLRVCLPASGISGRCRALSGSASPAPLLTTLPFSTPARTKAPCACASARIPATNLSDRFNAGRIINTPLEGLRSLAYRRRFRHSRRFILSVAGYLL